MAWNDPAPARGSRPSAPRASAPGYGSANSLPFLVMLGRACVALFIGGMVYVVIRSGLGAWHVAHGGGRAVTDMALALAMAVVVGLLVLRSLLRRPRVVGLSARVRDGGGWFGRRRGWGDDDGYLYPTFGQQVAADVAGDLVGAAIDALTD